MFSFSQDQLRSTSHPEISAPPNKGNLRGQGRGRCPNGGLVRWDRAVWSSCPLVPVNLSPRGQLSRRPVREQEKAPQSKHRKQKAGGDGEQNSCHPSYQIMLLALYTKGKLFYYSDTGSFPMHLAWLGCREERVLSKGEAKAHRGAGMGPWAHSKVWPSSPAQHCLPR